MSNAKPNGEREPLLDSSTSSRRSSHHIPNNHNPPSPAPNPLSHGDPSLLESFRNLFLGTYINILLVAVPLGFLSHFLHWGPTADFVINFLAIIPLAGLLSEATEQVALRLGETIGGLLNATFGNAVEAIVGILALVKGELRIVQTSLLGSILSNILLVLGCSFLASGLKFKESSFQTTAAQASSSLLILSTATLVIPAAYQSTVKATESASTLASVSGHDGLLTISRGTSVILLVMYMLYLFFQLKSHSYLFEAEEQAEEEEAKMNVKAAVAALLIVTVVTSFCADYLVGSIDQFANNFGVPKPFIGLILLPIISNACEHVTSVVQAYKGRTDLTIGVCVGSSIQIAIGVIPLLVVIGWIIGQEMTLNFEQFETIFVFLSVLLVNLVLTDGKSNWYEGAMLVALYVIVALAVYET
ncbi:uncharacterized protein L969DRAFT_89475 [Mixia osmundae IAM 14324]|uniref:Vacuolar calcium ion transporter n=1 Tax=Mixia osmundae (strain CBS 9802 / IAM 14324 / JCM 22182 / KY 12970) TaxID=764103 RepID=G7DS62_MIXOS|nr:uncharacterized protein L969DRAFT_89475 [Mixia osmundae IAM 14324]KEI37525.1 hypothetical protein L969DRAFT_89475 [Mixia osmundae IAM 14324]GAA93422.1 hypothetical protein E5Q_00063 [Mixia osmundae IAM 14324]